jgi:hypothetical protein
MRETEPLCAERRKIYRSFFKEKERQANELYFCFSSCRQTKFTMKEKWSSWAQREEKSTVPFLNKKRGTQMRFVCFSVRLNEATSINTHLMTCYSKQHRWIWKILFEQFYRCGYEDMVVDGRETIRPHPQFFSKDSIKQLKLRVCGCRYYL